MNFADELEPSQRNHLDQLGEKLEALWRAGQVRGKSREIFPRSDPYTKNASHLPFEHERIKISSCGADAALVGLFRMVDGDVATERLVPLILRKQFPR